MKKILTAITLSLGSLMASSAMAAPQYYDHSHDHDSRWDHRDDHRWDNDNRYQNKRVNPSRDWRSGQTLPRGYDSSRIMSVTEKHVAYPTLDATNSGIRSMVTMF